MYPSIVFLLRASAIFQRKRFKKRTSGGRSEKHVFQEVESIVSRQGWLYHVFLRRKRDSFP